MGNPLPVVAGFQAFGRGRFWVFANTTVLVRIGMGINVLNVASEPSKGMIVRKIELGRI
jgi:hypothetical protein